MIRAVHPDISGNNKTYLSSRAAAAQTVLTVLNNSEFAQNDWVVVGNLGESQSEIKKVTSVTNKDTITLAANLSFAHEKNAKVTKIDYDQVKFYKASSLTGTYNLATTKDIAADEPYTTYLDNTAVSTDYFKVTYYNSQSLAESGYSDPMPAFGFPRYALAMIVEAFLEEAQDKAEKFYNRAEVARWVNDCKDDIFNKLSENNEGFYSGYNVINLLADTTEYDLHAEFQKMKKIFVSYNGSLYEKARFEDLSQVSPNTTYSESTPMYYLKGVSKIGVLPTPASAVTAGIKVWSEDHPADLIDDADELPAPMNRYLDMVMSYIWYRALKKDKKFQESQMVKGSYENRRGELVEENNNLILNENRGVREPEDSEGYDELL